MTSVDRDRFLRRVEGYLGAPFADRGEGFPIDYATDPELGMDCSGLALRSLADVLGLPLVSALSPRGLRSNNDIFSAHFGANRLPPRLSSPAEAQPGDIACWHSGTIGGSYGHCAVVSGILSNTTLDTIHALKCGVTRGLIDLEDTEQYIACMTPDDVLGVLDNSFGMIL